MTGGAFDTQTPHIICKCWVENLPLLDKRWALISTTSYCSKGNVVIMTRTCDHKPTCCMLKLTW